MVFRISQPEQGDGRIVRIGGDLDDEAATTLRQQLDLSNGREAMPVLDVSEVRSVDRSGAELLVQAKRSGCELRGMSRFLELLIQRAGDDEEIEAKP